MWAFSTTHCQFYTGQMSQENPGSKKQRVTSHMSLLGVFSSAYWPCGSALFKESVQIFCIFCWIVCFFTIDLWGIFIYAGNHPFADITCTANTFFFPSLVACLFIFLMSRSISFWWRPTYQFFKVLNTFCVLLKNIFPWPRGPKNNLLCFLYSSTFYV